MITFDQFQKVMAFGLKKRYCIEILFEVNGSEKFDYCWMGKMPDSSTDADVYWFGLTDDGKNAYDFPTFDEMVCAKVFDGRSLLEIWNDITFLEVDGCDPMERFTTYLSGNGRFMGTAQ